MVVPSPVHNVCLRLPSVYSLPMWRFWNFQVLFCTIPAFHSASSSMKFTDSQLWESFHIWKVTALQSSRFLPLLQADQRPSLPPWGHNGQGICAKASTAPLDHRQAQCSQTTFGNVAETYLCPVAALIAVKRAYWKQCWEEEGLLYQDFTCKSDYYFQ